MKRSDASFWARILALAEFVEALVLANKIAIDLGNASIDQQISNHVRVLNLADVFAPTTLTDAPPSEHSRLIPTDLDRLDTLDVEDWAANLGPQDLKKVTDSVSDNLKLGPLYRDLDSLIDFSRFFLDAYDLMDKNPTRASLASFSTYSDVFSAFDSRELSQVQVDEFLLSLAIYFQGATESAVNESLRQGHGFMPLPLQSRYIASPGYRPSTGTMLGKIAIAHNAQGKDLRDLMFDKYSRYTQVPLLFGYIVSRAASLEGIFDFALSLREEKDVSRYRQWCTLLDQALEDGNQAEAIRLIDEVDKYVERLSSRKGWGLPKVDVQLAFPPSISFGLPEGLLSQRKNHLIFLRRVYQGTLTQLKIQDRIVELLR